MLVVLFINTYSNGQTTRYVPCGSGTPCYATIHDAIAASVNGDTIEVDAGTYSYTTQLSINKEIVLRAKPGLSTKPIISSTYSSYTSCMVQIAADNVIFDGFEINGNELSSAKYIFGDYGSPKNNWKVLNCKIHHGDMGIRIAGNNITIKGNEICETRGDCIDAEYGKCGGLKVIGNWLHSEHTDSGRKPAGITYNCDSTTVGDVEISYNYCHSCRTFIDFQHNGGTVPANNILIMHNTVDWKMEALPSPVPSSAIAQQMSIAFWTNGGNWDATKFNIRDNIFSRQKWYIILNTSGSSGPIVGNMELKNNLFYQWYLVDAYYPTYSYPEEWPGARGAVGWNTTDDDFTFTNNVQSDPLYKATGSLPDEYYALQLGSPAYHAASDGTDIGAWQTPVVIWTGDVDTDWDTDGNWNVNDVPEANTDVIIPNVTNKPVIDESAATPAVCNAITIETGSRVTINPGKAFTINGPLINNSSNPGILIKSNASGTGSLITLGSITDNGSVEIQRYITQSVWHLISVPNSVTFSDVFYMDYLGAWDEPSATWSDIVPTTVPLTVLKGYALWATPDKTDTYVYSGTPNTGDESIAVTYTEVPNSDYDGANLLGNPYPSAIDWSRLDDTWGAVYYFNGTAYVSWNNGTGAGSQYVPAMQGFFIITTSGSPGTFELTNDDRVHSAQNYYKSSIPDNSIVLETISNDYSDKLFIRLLNGTTENFDRQHDAYKLMSGTEGLSELYSFTGDKMLSIDVRPPCDVIQLGFKNSQNGVYNIGVNEITANSEVILEDTKTNTFHNLLKNSYEFVYDTLDDEKRFVLHLNAVGINDNIFPENKISIYASGKTINIQMQQSHGQGHLMVSDITGKIVLEKDFRYTGTATNIHTTLKQGVYLVSLIFNNKIETKKILIRE
jgi:hypothetical protein